MQLLALPAVQAQSASQFARAAPVRSSRQGGEDVLFSQFGAWGHESSLAYADGFANSGCVALESSTHRL